MAALPYMKFYVADYMADAAHLSTVEHGAYLLLLMTYWQKGSPLPDNDQKLARICRMGPREFARHKPILSEFFQIRDGAWSHKRVDIELAHVADKSLKSRKAGLASVESRLNGRSAIAPDPLNHTEADTDTDTDTDKKIPTVSPQIVVDLWNLMASQNGLSKVAKLTDRRRRSCQARLKADGLELIQQAIGKIPQSDFLCGRTGDWSADFDFLMQPDSVTKILEGKYDARNGNSQRVGTTQRNGAGRETGSITERAMQRAAERLGVEGPGFGSQGGTGNAIPSDDRVGSLPHARRSIGNDGGRQSQLAYRGSDGG